VSDDITYSVFSGGARRYKDALYKNKVYTILMRDRSYVLYELVDRQLSRYVRFAFPSFLSKASLLSELISGSLDVELLAD